MVICSEGRRRRHIPSIAFRLLPPNAAMFGWCCQVPELATITTVETTVWSANGVRTRFGPLLDNSGWCPGPVGFLQADMLAGVEWWKVTSAPVMVLLLRPLAGLQVLVDSCILGGVGGEEREVGSELPGV